MKGLGGFVFFLLFLGGMAFVNLKGIQESAPDPVAKIDDLADTTWKPTHLGELRVPDDTDMFLQFNADGSVVGYAGCNQFFGAASITDNQLSFGKIGSTRKACQEPFNSHEQALFESLRLTHAANRTIGRLILVNSSGLAVGRFINLPHGAEAN